MKKVAIIGSGISGLAAAHRLRDQAHVTVFEANDYFGGHTHTVDVTLPSATHPFTAVTHGVDTGFLVFNERTYPQLIALFAELGVVTAKSDMSFSVQAPHAWGPGKTLEWSGSNLNTVFAQRSNVMRPRFWKMLRDVLRFNALATAMAQRNADTELMQPLADFLKAHAFSDEFTRWYFLPMLGCIWSCPVDQMLQFPVATMVRFCHNHGLIQVSQRPQWWTVQGGARHYVDAILRGRIDARLNCPVHHIKRDTQGVDIHLSTHTERFDAVVLATHSDQALALLDQQGQATPPERAVLGAIRYQENTAYLHTDTQVLPQRRSAWAAWNYEGGSAHSGTPQVCLHYWLNQLQPLPFAQDVVVSLNPLRPIDPAKVLGHYAYAHPVFDLPAIQAQAALPALQGQHHTYFCGAWTGYGFHEDGLKSGLKVAELIAAHPATPH